MGCSFSRREFASTIQFNTAVVRQYELSWDSIVYQLYIEFRRRYPMYTLSVCLKESASISQAELFGISWFVAYEIRSNHSSSNVYDLLYTFDEPSKPVYHVNKLQVPSLCINWPKRDRKALQDLIEFHARYLAHNRKTKRVPWTNLRGEFQESEWTYDSHHYGRAFNCVLYKRTYDRE